MDDIERTLGDLAEESPPPEIVLAAVRKFRYQAIAVVASIIAAAVVLAVALQQLGPENLGAEAASLQNPITVPILADGEYDGITVTATEMVWKDGTGYVRFIAEDSGDHAEVTIEPITATTSSGKRIGLGPNPTLDLANYTTLDGARIDRRTDGGWVKVNDPAHDPYGPIAFEFRLVIQPLDVVLHGGELSGPFPTITIEHPGVDLP